MNIFFVSAFLFALLILVKYWDKQRVADEKKIVVDDIERKRQLDFLLDPEMDDTERFYHN